MIPIIVGAIMGGSALYGLVKGGKAVIDHRDASSTNDSAQSLISRATQLVNEQREATNSVIEDYGARKLRSFNGPVADFINTFGRLKNVEIANSPELEKLQVGDFTTQTLTELQKEYQLLMDSGLGLGAGLGSGAALAFGAYSGTMMFATASTGTAISALSGAAATNATLAWLGGGSLAAGGGGMALGTAVLGGIVAGPALAIFGHIVGNSAEAALANANSNLQQARTHYEEGERAALQLQSIQVVTRLANETFSKVTTQLRRSVHSLEKVIVAHGEDFSAFSQESREAVFRSVKYAQLVKAMIDTPILDESGALVLSTEKRIRDISDTAI